MASGQEYGQRGGSNGEDEADRRGIRMHRHRRRAAKVRKGTRRSGSAEPVAYAARELRLRRRHRRHCPSGRWSQQKASLSALEPFGVRRICFRPRSPVSVLRWCLEAGAGGADDGGRGYDAWIACAAPSLHAMAGTRARTVTMATVRPPLLLNHPRLCATSLSSLDAAVVTRRRRRVTSFAFPSGARQ